MLRQWKTHQQNLVKIELWKCPVGPYTHKSYRLLSYAKHITAAHLVIDKAVIVAARAGVKNSEFGNTPLSAKSYTT